MIMELETIALYQVFNVTREHFRSNFDDIQIITIRIYFTN